jgi:hypothetical protein
VTASLLVQAAGPPPAAPTAHHRSPQSATFRSVTDPGRAISRQEGDGEGLLQALTESTASTATEPQETNGFTQPPINLPKIRD